MMASSLPSFFTWSVIRRRAAACTRGVGSGLKKMLIWFVPMAVTATATAWLSYKYNQKSNTELALQQQIFSDLQSFRNSGAELDQSFSALSDSVVADKEVDDAKAKMRLAISKHLSDTMANEKSLGPASEAYIRALGALRETVDAVSHENVDAGVLLWNQSLKVMSDRRKLISMAQANVVTR